EVEIIYSGMEYDLEIDAATGTILEFESDSIYD
ncbi:MAG: peptidase, partial [Oscillospiraceae bacterium]|nr:peptidase [Oscillospiraceae bacterium]